MGLPLSPPIKPQLALTRKALPEGEEWAYEPKLDGFRAIVFVDGDPYGISNIYRTLKVGSGNAAHLSRFFCVPQARYLGVTPDDIGANWQLRTTWTFLFPH